MNCLEFKRLALSDPDSRQDDFVQHSAACPDCLKYVAEIRQMDRQLASSIDAKMPDDLVARLQLNQELLEEGEEPNSNLVLGVFPPVIKRYAVAASFVIAVFVAGFLTSNQFGPGEGIRDDYVTLLSSVVEHMDHVEITPVWDEKRANDTVNTLLASYDGKMQLKHLSNLQFSRICPMGKYRGLHATLETPDGQVTFAYIKGESVGDLVDAAYEGYVTRVKPIRGGNLIIISRTKKALQDANSQLTKAIYWDI